jgi:hypothetical protein
MQVPRRGGFVIVATRDESDTEMIVDAKIT